MSNGVSKWVLRAVIAGPVLTALAGSVAISVSARRLPPMRENFVTGQTMTVDFEEPLPPPDALAVAQGHRGHSATLAGSLRNLLAHFFASPLRASRRPVTTESARALVADWPRRYGVTPLLLETLVDPVRFDGASYRAANWIVVGTTSGRGRADRTHWTVHNVSGGVHHAQ